MPPAVRASADTPDAWTTEGSLAVGVLADARVCCEALAAAVWPAALASPTQPGDTPGGDVEGTAADSDAANGWL